MAPVGIFDSGVGGLTVARAIIDQLPDEDIIYVGDTANGPYGPLTIPEIRAHALAIGDDLVARGVTSGRQVLGLAEGYLEPLQRAEVDTLVLGCTHYPMLSGLIQLAMGDHVTLVSSAEETAKDLLRLLTELDLLRPHDAPPARRQFESTGDPEAFITLAARFLGPTLDGVRPVQRHVAAQR